MKSALRSAWLRLRSRFWLSLAFDAVMILLAFGLIHSWQTRNLPDDQAAPARVLASLDESDFRSPVVPGEVGIVYFFAPWCIYCKASIGNLQSLVDDGRLAWGTVIALDYSDLQDVREFIHDTGLSLPVLLGDAATVKNWSIRAFPTYYVIDDQGSISSRSVGYSTLAGMWMRAWWAGI